MAPDVENWDEDQDFHGDLFGASNSSGAPPSLSSRVSVRSESVAGDEDWQVLVTPNDEASKAKAISSAKQVGIPIPQNVPPSALLGGTIKKLQKKKSKRNVKEEDCDDLEIPDGFNPKLKLKPGLMSPDAPRSPTTPANTGDELDTDWAEGSLGIRFGGTRRELRNRSSSVSAANSAMSPSMGSCLTLESEEDELGGLVLPDTPIDFSERLKKKKEAQKEQELPQLAPSAIEPKQEDSTPVEQPQRKLSIAADEDPLEGLDLENVNLLDNRKRKFNINIKINETKVTPSPPRMATTTLTFTDKPTVSRIPRPAPPPGKSKLDPVYESMASHIAPRNLRPPPTTTGAQLLRSKRSAPALVSRSKESSRPPVPFLPAGVSSAQSSNIHTRPGSSAHGRTHSDHDRPASPPFRSFSRMSVNQNENTPSRASFRRDIMAPFSLARQALNQRTLNVTKKRQQYGNGSELDNFDDLPTSQSKESKYMKEPSNRGPPKTLRHQISRNQLRIPDRMNTPQPQPSYPSSVASTVPSTPIAPPTPRSGYFAVGAKPDTTPRFARDTAASRIRADQRLNSTLNPRDRPGGGGPLMPTSINWKAQVAARSPHTSPTTLRKRKAEGKQPILIKQMTPANLAKSKYYHTLHLELNIDANLINLDEKGMTYNPLTHRWEGNEASIMNFDNPSTITLPGIPTHKESYHHHHHNNSIPSGLALGIGDEAIRDRKKSNASPPRPALISGVGARDLGVRVERGMVFDPEKMRWLKLDPRATLDPNTTSPGHGSLSLSLEDEDDPFAGLPDLADENAGRRSEENKENVEEWNVGEEFDVGPGFVKRQRLEEGEWRRRVDGWMGGERVFRGVRWEWAIRDVAREYEGQVR